MLNLFNFLYEEFHWNKGEFKEWLVYKFIVSLLIAAFIVNIYDIVLLHVYDKNELKMRSITNIVMGAVLIFISGFLVYKIKYPITGHTQKSFMYHCSLFLFILAITNITIAAKHLE